MEIGASVGKRVRESTTTSKRECERMFRGDGAGVAPAHAPLEQVRSVCMIRCTCLRCLLTLVARDGYVRLQFKQRPRKSDSKRVWLDAIMSKARQSDTSPFASAASTPSSASGVSYAPRMSGPAPLPAAEATAQGMYAPHPSAPGEGPYHHHHPQQQRYHPHPRQHQLPPQQPEHWDAAPDLAVAYAVNDSVRTRAPVVYDEPLVREYYGAPPPQQAPHHSAPPLGPSSNSDVYCEQLELSDAVLSEAMTLAFAATVGAQDCCFIAKGICHLCGSSERHLIPVVNFCPAFHVNHSLCREHLRSTYRVRMEDIFAGKNRPTVSKRSLICAVCSRACRCSTCELEKQRELSKYRRWLAAESDAFELRRDDHAVPLDSSYSRPLDRDALDTIDSSASVGRAHGAHRSAPMHRQQHVETHHHFPDEPLARDSELRLHPVASAKPPSHPYRSAKRAAKETTASDGSPLMSRVPLESPSAAHVMNCAESEKSLVRLLTTLNQDAVTPPAVAEPKGPSSQAPGPLAASSKASPHNRPSLESEALAADAREGARNATAGQHGKRKRDDSAPGDPETSSEASARRGGPHSAQSADDADQSSARKKLSTQKRSDGVPKASPTPRAGAKAKAKDARPRSVPKASPSGRKRGGDTPVAGADKRSPAPRKGAKASAAAKSRRGKRASSAQDDDDEEEDSVDNENDGQSADNSENESEIDTNLDYCEVCFAAGDLVCCDVCPRSFHLACLKLRERDLPEGDWQCAECRKPSFFVRFRALVHMKQSLYGKCVETVRCLKSHPFAKQFLSPVKNIEHYTRVVKQPMDLTTIETKLKTGKYSTTATDASPRAASSDKTVDMDAFAHDVRLVWSNCKLFNDDGSGITRAADELARGFDAIYDDMMQYAARTKEATSRSCKSDETSASKATSAGGSTNEAGDGAREKSATEISTDASDVPAHDSAVSASTTQDADASTVSTSDKSSAKTHAVKDSPSRRASEVSSAAPSDSAASETAPVGADK